MKKEEELKEKIKKLEEALEKCQKEKEEYLEGWKRERADFLNYQREIKEKLEKIEEKAREVLIRDLLEVIDSLELAENSILDKKVCQGISLIKEKFLEILKKYGVEEIEVLGKEFDPLTCQAVGEVICQEEGKVVEVVQKGYALKNTILRAAKVKVGKKKEPGDSSKEKPGSEK
ncbi:nucleotide exchange factor GrpE [bacterium]|nr:nucleotide exchange factor GrpE [bacterium]